MYDTKYEASCKEETVCFDHNAVKPAIIIKIKRGRIIALFILRQFSLARGFSMKTTDRPEHNSTGLILNNSTGKSGIIKRTIIVTLQIIVSSLLFLCKKNINHP